MKQAKKDITLCEKDALQDMLDVEKQLLTFYTTALTEGSSQSFRKIILKNYSSSAESQFAIFKQMLSRGYYQVTPAPKMALDEKTEEFSKILKQIS